MTLQQPSLDRIAQFLDQMKIALRPHEKMAQARTMRLSALFDAVAGFRRENVPAHSVPERSFDEARFTSFLENLRNGLNASRHDGHLLNVWQIAGLKRHEVRTAAVLAWILDCNGSHGFGAAVMEELLQMLSSRPDGTALSEFSLGKSYLLQVEHSPFSAHEDRVDLAVEGENCVIFIEVKIDAPQGFNQLDRYSRLAKEKAAALKKEKYVVLYLSEYWPAVRSDEIVCLRWRDVAQAIVNATSTAGRDSISKALLKQFAVHVRTLH